MLTIQPWTPERRPSCHLCRSSRPTLPSAIISSATARLSSRSRSVAKTVLQIYSGCERMLALQGFLDPDSGVRSKTQEESDMLERSRRISTMRYRVEKKLAAEAVTSDPASSAKRPSATPSCRNQTLMDLWVLYVSSPTGYRPYRICYILMTGLTGLVPIESQSAHRPSSSNDAQDDFRYSDLQPQDRGLPLQRVHLGSLHPVQPQYHRPPPHRVPFHVSVVVWVQSFRQKGRTDHVAYP